jgi:hypothetical protein
MVACHGFRRSGSLGWLLGGDTGLSLFVAEDARARSVASLAVLRRCARTACPYTCNSLSDGVVRALISVRQP